MRLLKEEADASGNTDVAPVTSIRFSACVSTCFVDFCPALPHWSVLLRSPAHFHHTRSLARTEAAAHLLSALLPPLRAAAVAAVVAREQHLYS
ncbi:hypothetical protein [Methanimicrococcus blatticola]|uniref:hypothetical protein n=1 Tax=Methanimicrococcus blatticola TaxID=91560 RepID=UPI00106040C9|nr:hypothetical protein [Methanimicrococcus blatticola]MBZ3935709.1 hypothetical protein [Methanimicrococcus blatticola]MCC2508170.1 hypothetical protein [Methanimicrococcus blatticola]